MVPMMTLKISELYNSLLGCSVMCMCAPNQQDIPRVFQRYFDMRNLVMAFSLAKHDNVKIFRSSGVSVVFLRVKIVHIQLNFYRIFLGLFIMFH